MKAVDQMIKQGYWLFRYRSYMPVFLLLFVFIVVWFHKQIYSIENIWFDLSCLVVSLCGEIIRIIAVGYAADRTSGRNTKQQVADEINQTGIYSLIRHPLYVGNFFMWLGLALYTRVWWLVLVFVLLYFLYYERIIVAEEDYLSGKFGDDYTNFASKVPCIFPNYNNYIPNKNSFRLKKVLRQENSSVFGLILTFFIIELYEDIISKQQLLPEKHWIYIGAVSILTYITLRTLKKKTRVLHNDKKQ